MPSPVFPTVTGMCWDRKDGQLVPRRLSLPPISKACSEIKSCGCTKGCLSRLCSCRKNELLLLLLLIVAKHSVAATYIHGLSIVELGRSQVVGGVARGWEIINHKYVLM